MYKEWINILKKSHLFDGIDDLELDLMLECIRPDIKKYKKNEYLIYEGEKNPKVGIVLSGLIAIIKENAEGERIIITLVNSSEMFGEIAAFSGKNIWPASVYAQEDSFVLFLAPEKITGNCERMCISHRLLINNIMKIVAARALNLNKKVEYLGIKSIRGKISTFLYEEYTKNKSLSFKLPMKRNELADFLNVTRPSLSREMCNMRDEGIIEFERSEINIKDLSRLKAF